MNAEHPDSDVRLARQAYDLTADLMTPQPRIYWTDLAVTTLLAYGGLYLAMTSGSAAVTWSAAVVAVFAVYRGLSFIHELTHLRSHEAPGFKIAWNALIGVPFLAPSLLYDGVHSLHHAKDRYGTARDPEYLALARSTPWGIAGFVAVAALAPLGQVLRFGIMTPVSLLVPAVRRMAVARASAMTINPGFQRQDHEMAARPAWLAQEIGCWLWSWTVAGLAIAGVIPVRAVVVGVAVSAAATVINQLRTAGAHAWENDGGKMSFPGQFRDSVNVPPPALLPALWAPVGLRYHALHHLLPRLPYHNLAKAHRRLAAALPATSAYHAVNQPNLRTALAGLAAKARANRAAPQGRRPGV